MKSLYTLVRQTQSGRFEYPFVTSTPLSRLRPIGVARALCITFNRSEPLVIVKSGVPVDIDTPRTEKQKATHAKLVKQYAALKAETRMGDADSYKGYEHEFATVYSNGCPDPASLSIAELRDLIREAGDSLGR